MASGVLLQSEISQRASRQVTSVALRQAAFGKLDAMDFLLRNLADVRARDENGSEPLLMAVESQRSVDVVKWLLEKAASAADAGQDSDGWHCDSNYAFVQ